VSSKNRVWQREYKTGWMKVRNSREQFGARERGFCLQVESKED
jgi:hypothetical protein